MQQGPSVRRCVAHGSRMSVLGAMHSWFSMALALSTNLSAHEDAGDCRQRIQGDRTIPVATSGCAQWPP